MSDTNTPLPEENHENTFFYTQKEDQTDIQEIQRSRIITFYSQMIDNAESEKEVWDIISIFMKIHKDDKKVVEEVVLFCENHLPIKKLNSADKYRTTHHSD